MQDLLQRLRVDVRVYAAAASIVLSLWCLALDDVINHDGVLYLRVAELIVGGKWAAAVELYKWPFYSILIAGVSALSGLPLERAAHALNAALSALAVVSFITAVKVLGGDRRTLIAAALLVLLYPGLNKYRAFVIRDFGYVAFYLLALVFFFKTLKRSDWRLHVGWALSALTAALFRIEGFAFVLAMPMVLLLRRLEARALYPIAAAVTLAAFGVMFLAFSWWTVGPAGGLLEMLSNGVDRLLDPHGARLAALHGQVLPIYSSEHAVAVLLAGGAAILLVEVIGRATIINILLAGHALYRKLAFPLARARGLWFAMLGVHLMVLVAIVAGVYFLTGRFSLAFSLTLMLATPFSAALLYREWTAKRTRRTWRQLAFPAAALLVVLHALPALIGSTQKSYLKEAGHWFQRETAREARVFTNDSIFLHYSRRGTFEQVAERSLEHTLEILHSGRWRNYDYVALRVSKSERAALAPAIAGLSRSPVVEFKNERGDRFLVFVAK